MVSLPVLSISTPVCFFSSATYTTIDDNKLFYRTTSIVDPHGGSACCELTSLQRYLTIIVVSRLGALMTRAYAFFILLSYLDRGEFGFFF